MTSLYAREEEGRAEGKDVNPPRRAVARQNAELPHVQSLPDVRGSKRAGSSLEDARSFGLPAEPLLSGRVGGIQQRGRNACVPLSRCQFRSGALKGEQKILADELRETRRSLLVRGRAAHLEEPAGAGLYPEPPVPGVLETRDSGSRRLGNRLDVRQGPREVQRLEVPPGLPP